MNNYNFYNILFDNLNLNKNKMNIIHGRNNSSYFTKIHTKLPQNLIFTMSNNSNNKKNCNTDYINTNLNENTIQKKLNKSRSFQAKKIMEDFKATIKQTQALKNRIINSKYNIPKSKSKNTLNINFNDNISIIHKDQDSNISNIIDNSLNFDLDKINKMNNNNYPRNKNKIIYKSCSNLLSERKKRSQNDIIQSMNFSIKKLVSSNNKIINQNNFLENEIDKFKSIQKKNNLFNMKKPSNYFDISLNNFINGLKFSLQKNIIENLQLAKNISDLLKIMNSIYNNCSSNHIIYNNLYNKIITENKNASSKNEINSDEKKIDKMKDEQIKLNKELNRLKIYLKDLKTKDNILSLKYESNLKSKQDFEEIVLKLNNTIRKLKAKNITISRASSYKTIDFNNKNNNPFDIYEIKKKQLNNIIKCIQNQKHILIGENYKIKKENKDLNSDKEKKEKDNSDEIYLKQKLNEMKKENNIKKKDLEKKEKQIIILKQIIDKINLAIKENNTDNTERKVLFDLDKLIKDDSEDNDFKNLLKENKLEEDIKNATFLNAQKLDEINYTTKKYEECIKDKDQIINDLENIIDNKKVGLIKTLEEKVKPLYKKNTIPRGNSFTFTNKNDLKISNNKFLKLNKSTNVLKTKKQNYFIVNEFENNE